MDIREIDTTFHGRRVIQVDEIFFVDTQMDAAKIETEWVSDQHITLNYQGCLFSRVDTTAEFFRVRHPDYVLPTDEELECAFREAGCEYVRVESSTEPSCRRLIQTS